MDDIGGAGDWGFTFRSEKKSVQSTLRAKIDMCVPQMVVVVVVDSV